MLFENCVFAFVKSGELPKSRVHELQHSLETHGGEVKELKSDGNIDLNDLTHIISFTSDFPQYSEARDQLVAVVTPNWITHSLMKNKQGSLRPFTPDPKLFFSNVNVSCADIPPGDKDAIVGAVLAMGGLESSSVAKLTTHICALTMDHPKCRNARENSPKIKLVLPHWFDDCLRLGKRIDEAPYLLPDPEIFRLGSEDALAIPPSTHLEGAICPRPDTLPTPNESLPPPSRKSRTLAVFHRQAVLLSGDLDISSHLRTIIENLVEGSGGSIVKSVHEADIFVCHWRDGRDYTFASRAGIYVGNLSWLYHLIAHDKWTDPLRRLLHYPLPRNGIPCFKDFKITLSNYGGEARIYLENLVVAAGGEFTKNMKQDNTHLITARKSSEKCNAASDWNINMTNHLWLEESYAKCQVQALTDPRYNHFPPRTNLGEIIGQTQFDPKIIESLYFPRDPTPSPDDPKPLRRKIMHEKSRNLAGSPNSTEVTPMKGQKEEANRQTSQPPPSTNKRPRSRASTLADAVTPAAKRRSLGKENDTPSSTGSRSAKDKAANKIHGLADDIALYEKEKKRKGPVWGGERAANNIEKEKMKKAKESTAERSLSPAAKEDNANEHGPLQKRVKSVKGGLPPAEIRLLITGYTEWIGNPRKEDIEKKKLRELGILIVQDPTNCSHLAAPAMVRTKKFLCALAAAPIILSTDFIDSCLQKGAIPDPKGFLLKDTENEKKFDIKLKDAVARAKANNRRLLSGTPPIHCTSIIKNGADTYRAIVEANGGKFIIYNGKPTIKETKPEEDLTGPEPVYLLTGPQPKEKELWPKFIEMAKKGNMIPRVVHTEWLLDAAMSQRLDWNEDNSALDD